MPGTYVALRLEKKIHLLQLELFANEMELM